MTAMATADVPEQTSPARRLRWRTVLPRSAALLIVVAAALYGLYRWPWWALLFIYAATTLLLIAQYVRRVFLAPAAPNAQSALLINLYNARLSLDPPFKRMRRYASAMLVVVAQAVLWPRNWVASWLLRPLLRRNELGQTMPKVALVVFFYVQYALHTTLLALLVVAVVVLNARGAVHTPVAIGLVTILAVSLFARHFAMLLFPEDLKAAMRRMPGDPRLYFIAFLIIDTATFAAIVQFLAVQAGTLPLGAAGFMRAIAKVMSMAEVRALWTAIEQGFEIGNVALPRTVWAALASITPAQALGMVCSLLVYLNIVRMLFPLQSWQQTDDDLRFMAHGMLMSGDRARAAAYVQKIKSYDVQAAQLDAQIATAGGDLKAAAAKLRWAHARNALGDDPDLVFVDIIGPLAVVPNLSVTFAQCVTFALESEVSDVMLAVMILFFGAVGQRENAQVLQVLAAHPRAPAYPLSRAAAELWNGQADRARELLQSYEPTDVVARCANILLREVASSDGNVSPTINQAADEVCRLAADEHNDTLPLARQLMLVSIISVMRCAVAATGTLSSALTRQMSALVARVSALHPSHRESASFLESYSRIAEAQVLRDVRGPR
jgi:hypothetical protein